MARKNRTITSKALQILLTRIGSASSGAKATLRERFLRDVERSRLQNCHANWNARGIAARSRTLRIISIDMGIKNLAFCDAKISYPTGSELQATMEVLRWKKFDLVQQSQDLRARLPSLNSVKKGSAREDEDVDPYSLSVLSETAYRLIKHTILSDAPDIVLIEKQRWRSGGGSAIQQWTVRVNTLEGMLWAVLATLRAERVYMTPQEREIQAYTKKDFEVYAVDPKRVGTYWLQQGNLANITASNNRSPAKKSKAGLKSAQEQDMKDDNTLKGRFHEDEEGEGDGGRQKGKKKIPRTKAEKKAKINLLQSWLNATPPSTTCTPHSVTRTCTKSSTSESTSGTGTPCISFILHPSTNPIRDALCARDNAKAKASNDKGKAVSKAKSRSKSIAFDLSKAKDIDAAEAYMPPEEANGQEVEFKKLDDVTDCFLQAAAWVSWEANRLQLMNVRAKGGQDGSETMGEGEERALLDMFKEVGGG